MTIRGNGDVNYPRSPQDVSNFQHEVEQLREDTAAARLYETPALNDRLMIIQDKWRALKNQGLAQQGTKFHSEIEKNLGQIGSTLKLRASMLGPEAMALAKSINVPIPGSEKPMQVKVPKLMRVDSELNKETQILREAALPDLSSIDTKDFWTRVKNKYNEIKEPVKVLGKTLSTSSTRADISFFKKHIISLKDFIRTTSSDAYLDVMGIVRLADPAAAEIIDAHRATLLPPLASTERALRLIGQKLTECSDEATEFMESKKIYLK